MDLPILILSAALVWLGIVNWRLSTRLQDLNEQLDLQSELIMGMANELKELGSENVSVIQRDPPIFEIKL
jgi:hypothetical protein